MGRVEHTHLIEQAVEPKSVADRKELHVALVSIMADDPSFAFYDDPESGQTVMKGMSEPHLDSKADILKRIYDVDVITGAPHVAYRETLGRPAEIEFTHKRQVGGAGEFARVTLLFEPLTEDAGFRFNSAIAEGVIPIEFISGVKKGLEAARQNGLLAGFPVSDFRATLIDGAYHDLDSNALTFEVAARQAFRKLRDKASPKLLEPIMKIEVVASTSKMGDVIGDLNARRGQIDEVRLSGEMQHVTAFVPLANMFGYDGALMSFTGRLARYSMQYHRYAPVELPYDDPGYFPPAVAMRA